MEIEELELEVKVYNRLKKAGINTTDELLSEMYKGNSDIKVSAPDAKRCEEALKAVGIIKYVRGDYVTEDDIEPEPLTWDELRNCIGKLVAHDVSTELLLSVIIASLSGGIFVGENVESIQQIGVTKLALLAKLDEPQREEVQQNVDVEAVSVRELKKQIAALNNEAAKQRKLREELVDENNQMSNRISALLADNDEAKDTIQSLEQQLEELEERPIDVAVQTLPDDEEIEKLTAQFKEDLAKHEKDTERRLEELRQHYRKELKEQYDRLTKEAEQANVDVEEEITEKAELECTIKFATDALRRLARYVMSIDSEDKAYARYAIKKVDEVYDILRKFEEEK